jgi:hypothetical protein
LINPNREQMPWPAIPIGLCSVASAVADAGHDVELLDLTFSREPARDTRVKLLSRDPDVVGISCSVTARLTFSDGPEFRTAARASKASRTERHACYEGS